MNDHVSASPLPETPLSHRRRQSIHVRRLRAFTLLEAIVVVAIIGLLATIAIGAYLQQLPRIRLQNAAQETTSFLRQARQEAIRASLPVKVTVETLKDDPVTADNPEGISQQWLIASLDRPDGTLEERRQVLVSRRNTGIFLRGPEAADLIGTNGFTFTGGELTIRANGTVVDTGAIRISAGAAAGGDADPRNVLEIVYTTRAGTPVTRKWLTSSDSPTGAAGFFEQQYSDGSSKSLWEWY